MRVKKKRFIRIPPYNNDLVLYGGDDELGWIVPKRV
jgi:hypothetical protein